MTGKDIPKRVLVVDDQEAESICLGLPKATWTAVSADKSIDAKRHLVESSWDAVVLDMRMPNENNPSRLDTRAGLKLLAWLMKLRTDIPAIMLTAYGTNTIALEAVELGAMAFVDRSALISLPEVLEKVITRRRATRPKDPVDEHDEALPAYQVGRGRSFQLAGFPDPCWPVPQLSVAGRNMPSHGISGDCFDYVYDQPTNSLHFFIGDVMHHGLGPGLIATRMTTLFRLARRLRWSPLELDHQLHQSVLESRVEGLYVTGIIGVLHVDAHRIEWLNAGHAPPSLRGSSGLGFLESTPLLGDVWGLDTGERVQPGTQTLVFGPGSSLLLYSDGIVENGIRGSGSPVASTVAGKDRLTNAHQSFTPSRYVDADERDRANPCQALRLCHHVLCEVLGEGQRVPAKETYEVFYANVDDDLTVLALSWDMPS